MERLSEVIDCNVLHSPPNMAFDPAIHETQTYPFRLRGWVFSVLILVLLLLPDVVRVKPGEVFYALLSVFLLAVSVVEFINERQIISAPVSTSAEIVVLEGKRRFFVTRYRFIAQDGEMYFGKSRTWGGRALLLEGQHLHVIYKRDNPLRNLAASDFHFYKTV